MKTSPQSGRTGLCKPAHPIPVRTFLPQAFALVLLALVVIPVLRASDSQVKPGDGNHDSLASLQSGLGSLPFLSRGRTRSVSAENPTGEKGRGGMAIPNPTEPKPAASGRAADTLGQGWKVRPFLRVNAGQTALLMDVAGPGIIQHMWIVEGLNRGLVLRFYWDDEKTPSIESPVPDFFCVGHGRFAPVNSLPVVVNPANALNCYWPMPFHKHARITLSNETDKDVELVAYQITYLETEVPANAGTFHAQYRRASTAERNPYVILDGVKGNGRYVGTFLAWTQMKKGWFGEGEIKFYLDGDGQFPTICGTGTEDYFQGSYGFPQPYTTAYSGTVLPASENAVPPNFWSLYRWHIQDPVNFEQDLKVTIQALGWGSGGKYLKLSDNIASVAYWYQTEPHTPFPKLPSLSERLWEPKPGTTEIPGAIECESLKSTSSSSSFSAAPQDLTAYGNGWSGGAQLFVQAQKPGDFVELEILSRSATPKSIILHATRAPDYGTLGFTVNGEHVQTIFDGYAGTPTPSGAINLGLHVPKNGKYVIRIEVTGSNPAATGSKYFFGLDALVVSKL